MFAVTALILKYNIGCFNIVAAWVLGIRPSAMEIAKRHFPI